MSDPPPCQPLLEQPASPETADDSAPTGNIANCGYSRLPTGGASEGGYRAGGSADLRTGGSTDYSRLREADSPSRLQLQGRSSLDSLSELPPQASDQTAV